MLSVIVLRVWGGRGCSCKWEGRKPSVGKGGKRRVIARRVGGKERAETIVQLSKEAVIEGVRIWQSIFLQTLKFQRKEVILCLIQCCALTGKNLSCTRLLFQFSCLGQKLCGGIRRALHVCLPLAFHSEIQAFFARLGHKIIFFFHSSPNKKFGFLLSLKSKVTAVKDTFPMTSALHLSGVVEVCSLLP